MVRKQKDARLWWKKWSTWLAGLSASMIAGAGSIMFFGADYLPKWVPMAIAFVAVVLVPVATSISQWPSNEPDES